MYPREHVAQVSRQLVVLGFKLTIYMAVAETGILYYVVILCVESVLQDCHNVLIATAGLMVGWAYEDSIPIPRFVSLEKRLSASFRYSFWLTANKYVNNKGSSFPQSSLNTRLKAFIQNEGGSGWRLTTEGYLTSSTSHFK